MKEMPINSSYVISFWTPDDLNNPDFAHLKEEYVKEIKNAYKKAGKGEGYILVPNAVMAEPEWIEPDPNKIISMIEAGRETPIEFEETKKEIRKAVERKLAISISAIITEWMLVPDSIVQQIVSQ